jgi:hypothetical protein
MAMTKMLDAPIVFSHSESIERALVVSVNDEGLVDVRTGEGVTFARCAALQTGPLPPSLKAGDEVLVLCSERDQPVLLGRIGSVAAPNAKPETLTLAAERDIVIKNERAKIKLTAEGGIEIVCDSLSARAQRLLRLLAPLIKLN